MSPLLVIVISFFLLVYGGMNYYIGLRGWQAFFGHFSFINPKLYWLIIALLASAYLVARFSQKMVPAWLHQWLSTVGAVWLAVFFYSFLFTVCLDILRFINHRLLFIPKGLSEGLSGSPYLGGGVILLILGLLLWGGWNAQHAYLKEYTISLHKSAGQLSSLNIIMVSDLHLGTIIQNSHLTELVDRINREKPDVVFLVGDVIDEDIEPFITNKMGETFKQIKAPYGKYAVLGNHEYIGRNVDAITKELTEAGITVLRDEMALVANSIYLVGRDDLSGESFTKTPRRSLEMLMGKADPRQPVIVLDHQPSQMDEALHAGADLQLSGHTHKGQLFPLEWVTGRLFKNDYGLLQEGNFYSVVSSGYGTWGPPIRLGSRAEIVKINLLFSK